MQTNGAMAGAVVGFCLVLGFAPIQVHAQVGPVSIAHQFDLSSLTVQNIALLEENTSNCLSGGMGSVQHPWDIDPLVLMPTANVTLSVRLIETELNLNPGSPIVNVLLYGAPRDAGDFCLGLLDTSTKVGTVLYTGELQQPGSTYGFHDPQTGAPIVLQTGQSYFLYAHAANPAGSGVGPVNVVFTLTAVGASAPALSPWAAVTLVGLLLAVGTLALKTRSQLRT